MPDKRVDALNSLNKNDYNSKYITLSDNTKIGVNLIKDLIKYFQLEFKNKYRYNYRKWTFEGISNPEAKIHEYKCIAPEGNANAVSSEPNTKTEEDTIIYKIIEGQDDDGIAIDKLKKYIKKIYSGEKQDDSNYIEIPEEIFNRDIGLRKNYRDSSINDGYIPIIVIDCDGETPLYFKPLLEYNYTNYDFQEKSQMYDDLNKLNSIFKKSNYKDLDDLVILDFYKEFTKKVEKLKDDIISSDDDVKYDIIDNIYDKLAIIYEIKIGRNKKIVKKPIKEIVDGTRTGTNKTPKDICDIAKEENETGKKTLFNDILCEINKRAQIFNNIKKGGKKAIRRVGGAPNQEPDLNTFVNKLLTVASGDENLRYNAYLEIDKNILEGFINNTALKEHITNLQTTKSLSNFSNMTQQFFKISPKKIYGKIDEKNITFASFNKFIEKIKDRMVEDSTRYLAIIKSLNIIMNTTLGLQDDNTQTNTQKLEGKSGEEGEKAPGKKAAETAQGETAQGETWL